MKRRLYQKKKPPTLYKKNAAYTDKKPRLHKNTAHTQSRLHKILTSTTIPPYLPIEPLRLTVRHSQDGDNPFSATL